MKASITSISNNGEVKIKFNLELIVPNDTSQINEDVLEVILIEGEYSDRRKLGFKWSLMEFDGYSMILKLVFEYAEYVSANEVKL